MVPININKVIGSYIASHKSAKKCLTKLLEKRSLNGEKQQGLVQK